MAGKHGAQVFNHRPNAPQQPAVEVTTLAELNTFDGETPVDIRQQTPAKRKADWANIQRNNPPLAADLQGGPLGGLIAAFKPSRVIVRASDIAPPGETTQNHNT